jgi:hypothetical protein
MAGKRSNPLKLLRDQAEIMIDKAGREVGEAARSLGKAYDDAVARKRLRKNPPPAIGGAKVTGFKKPDSTA